ncbi:MAG: hypothetical protein WC444_00595 [Candidatus Paceibacterota bacterium]
MKKSAASVKRHPFTVDGITEEDSKHHPHRVSRNDDHAEDRAAADRSNEEFQPLAFYDSPTMANVFLP